MAVFVVSSRILCSAWGGRPSSGRRVVSTRVTMPQADLRVRLFEGDLLEKSSKEDALKLPASIILGYETSRVRYAR